MVDAGYEGSFRYGFTPGELSGGRTFGLLINIHYKDAVGFVVQLFSLRVTFLTNAFSTILC